MTALQLKRGEGTPFDQLADSSPRPAPVAAVMAAASAAGGVSLDELAAIANQAHKRVHLAGRDLLEHAIRAGDALLEARRRVERGQWGSWALAHLEIHLTTAHRYMRLAEHRERVLASSAGSIAAAMQLLVDEPRRGHGPRRYTDADKADWAALAEEIGIKPAARALGVSPSTIHKWVSPRSPDRGQIRQAREITPARIERVAGWLVDRFGGRDYPEQITGEVRVDAARLLAAIFESAPVASALLEEAP